MDATVIKLLIMLAVAFVTTLALIGLEVRNKMVKPLNTGAKAVVAVVIAGLFISII